MGVASGCGEQEVGVASGSGWNLWVWLLGVVVRRYIDFLILLIPTPLVSVLFAAASLLFVHFKKCTIRRAACKCKACMQMLVDILVYQCGFLSRSPHRRKPKLFSEITA